MKTTITTRLASLAFILVPAACSSAGPLSGGGSGESAELIARNREADLANSTTPRMGAQDESLSGSFDDPLSCAVDSDCVALPADGCCPSQRLVAMNKRFEESYERELACTLRFRLSSRFIDPRVPICDPSTRRCEMIAPQGLPCGGFVAHPHTCPVGYVCRTPPAPDVGGSCERECIACDAPDTDTETRWRFVNP